MKPDKNKVRTVDNKEKDNLYATTTLLLEEAKDSIEAVKMIVDKKTEKDPDENDRKVFFYKLTVKIYLSDLLFWKELYYDIDFSKKSIDDIKKLYYAANDVFKEVIKCFKKAIDVENIPYACFKGFNACIEATKDAQNEIKKYTQIKINQKMAEQSKQKI